MLVPQLFVCEKSFVFGPAMVRALIIKVAVPVFIRVTTCGAAVVPRYDASSHQSEARQRHAMTIVNARPITA